MTKPGIRSWLGTAFLLLAILILGLLVAREQHRETRLKAALARFQNREHQEIYSTLNYATLDPTSSPLSLVSWGGNSSLETVLDHITALTTRAPIRGPRRVLSVEVDATGLQETGLSLKSVAKLPAAPTDLIEIRAVVLQMLAPFDLAYQVKDGRLTITSQKQVRRLDERILKHLDDRIVISWSSGDSLQAVIERVRERSRGPNFPEGLPIFLGVRGDTGPDERLTLASTGRDELPIRDQLSRLLAPLALRFDVQDGALLIVKEPPAPLTELETGISQ